MNVGINDAILDCKLDHLDEDNQQGGYSNLIIDIYQRCDASFKTQIDINCISSEELLALSSIFLGLAKELEGKEKARDNFKNAKKVLQTKL